MSTPSVDPSAFELGKRGGRSQLAVLCLHGLTGTPYEVRSLAEALATRGARVRGPWLAGHGGPLEALLRTSYLDWIAGVRAEVALLREGHDRVVAVGLSLGGLLSLDLAVDGLVDAVVSVAAPIALPPPIPQLIPVLRRFVSYTPKRTGSDIRDPQARAVHPSSDAMPLPAVHELVRLQASLRPRLGELRVPALIAHGRHDRTARPSDAQRIFDALGSPQKELLWLARSGHVVPVDYDRAQLAAASADFLLGAAAAHGADPGKPQRPLRRETTR